MQFGILGPLQINRQAEPVPLTGAKRRLLLIALLVQANRLVPVAQLAEWIWPKHQPVSAIATIQAHISTLRRDLEADRSKSAPPGLLLTRPPGYLIRIDVEQLDALRFERLTGSGALALRQGRPGLASAELTAALALWRGAPLAEAADAAIAQGEIARLEELRLTATMLRNEADLALGRHLELIPELSQLVFRYPLHERFYGQLMIALSTIGRRGDALDVYRRAREILARELAIGPGPGLREVRAIILARGEDTGAPLPAGESRR
jgi:DNA-binding SARP family transcriptional activator